MYLKSLYGCSKSNITKCIYKDYLHNTGNLMHNIYYFKCNEIALLSWKEIKVLNLFEAMF